MAFSSPPRSQPSVLLFLLLLLLIASAAKGATPATNSQESDDMLQSLRNYGYTLFTNGISTSDLKYQLLSASDSAAAPTSNFTLFAPRDELLYALDMAADAAVYVSNLRYHVIPNRRHTFADLKNLSVPFLDTLLPHYAVLIGKVRDVDVSNDRASIAVVVDGVRVSFPDLYVGSRIAVHGIDGILLTGLNMSRDLDGNDRNPPAASPAPAVGTNMPAENHHASSALQFDRNNNVSPAPAQGRTLNVSVSPASNEGDIPAEGSLNPNAPTPAPSNARGDIPAERIPPTTPTSQFSRSNNIPAAATPTISQDQTEKMKRLGAKKKQKGKAQRKGRSSHHHHHRRSRALGNL